MTAPKSLPEGPGATVPCSAGFLRKLETGPETLGFPGSFWGALLGWIL